MTNQKGVRLEKDSLGTFPVPDDAYYGSNTARALKNFKISNLKADKVFKTALGIIKVAALGANAELHMIKRGLVPSIKKACFEFIEGKFDDQFNLDVFQAGAGTSYNMNCNEIIANRANEILKAKKGSYKYVHPNNHINLAQSTNDVIPTAIRIATLFLMPPLINSIKELENGLSKIARKHQKTLKVGRTHLQDAVPITFGQEMDAYVKAIQNSRQLIQEQSKDLQIINIGGTAVGTGINTHPEYQKLVIKNLFSLCNIKFKPAKNLTEIGNNMNSFLNISAGLRSLCINILNLCRNLRMMNMGPKAGLSEITLPAVQPGSSIMPGKVNPSILEAMEMVCMEVLGNDKTIELACQYGEFDLNPMGPIIMHNLLESITILTNGLKTLNNLAISGIVVNKKRLQKIYEKSLCTGTALTHYLGYEKTAEVINSALKKELTIRQELLRRKLFTPAEIKEILSVKNTTRPAKLNGKITKKS